MISTYANSRSSTSPGLAHFCPSQSASGPSLPSSSRLQSTPCASAATVRRCPLNSRPSWPPHSICNSILSTRSMRRRATACPCSSSSAFSHLSSLLASQLLRGRPRDSGSSRPFSVTLEATMVAVTTTARTVFWAFGIIGNAGFRAASDKLR